MKRILVLVVLVLVLVGCKEEVVEKPAKLIDKKTMTNILYDMALTEAIKYQYPYAIDSNNVSTSKYIFKKYKIDSLQFAQNNVYYASHFDEYKEMFEAVNDRVKNEKIAVDSVIAIKRKKDSITNKKKKTTAKPKGKIAPKKDEIDLKVNMDSIKESIKAKRHKLSF